MQIKYHDSLKVPHPGCQAKAQEILSTLVQLQVPVSSTRLPTADQSVLQEDGYSCGYHVVNRFEEEFRQFRGEGIKRVYMKPDQRRRPLNRFCQLVMEACKPVPESQPAAPQPPAASNKAQPLPLPAPAAEEPVYGCSKCRYMRTGCLSCNPEKAVRHVKRQASL